ncbi:MAG: DUF3237 domain-containing protein [Actinobacteria bacterium]|nr:DUF3237 domain-containing protein [Actinomycetota bacterium]MCI0544208.1 DUF3237 domain-containing protein [Actinomycetota bacterium]MCI0678961.1 DUF3237 domain-containing protein [Actinomycetota bacterium]
MPSLEQFCTVSGDLGMNVIGQTPNGMRIDFPFTGTATSSHWDGERPVSGVDYVTVRADGNMELDIHGVIGEKREKVAYAAIGVSIANPDGSADPKELIRFHTANEDLAWLNDEIAVAFGHGAAGKISLEIFLIRP